MDNLTLKEKIDLFTDKVSQESLARKRESGIEEQINELLDGILNIKTYFKTLSEKLDEASKGLQSITWHEGEIKAEDVKAINSLIAACRDLHHILVRKYASASRILHPKGVATEELKLFKEHLHGFKEDYQIVEEVFIINPRDTEVQSLIDSFRSLQ